MFSGGNFYKAFEEGFKKIVNTSECFDIPVSIYTEVGACRDRFYQPFP